MSIIFLSGFFILFGYYNTLTLLEEKQYEKLTAVVTSTAISVNGDEHQELFKRYKNPEDINSPNDDWVYFKWNQFLNKIVDQNKLNSPIYTLVVDTTLKKVFYGIRSDDYVDFRNEYVKYPPEIMENYETGGVIPKYTSENGEWISAFYPIKNGSGNVVAIIEADIKLSEFIALVNEKYMNQGLIAIAVILLVAFILIPYARKILKEEERRNQTILLSKKIIEEKNKEILDSIQYAKRIQKAILPSDKLINSAFAENFVLYLPKDVVAGDFYFLEKTGNTILFAAADCTGHGVPGAMVSVVCHNALNRSVKEFGLTKPNEILDKTREIVIQEFEKSGEEVKDGMDISLVALQQAHSVRAESESDPDSYRDSSSHSVSSSVQWSGANNPLWLMRDGELIEYKPDKQPIGLYAEQKPFTSHEIELQKGDVFYLITDGFQDQFGGNGGKKFKPSQLKSLILSIYELPMHKQKEEFINAFDKWKGDLEQVDDICLIGFRI